MTAALITPRQAYDIASQWGSYITSGDPGAAFYTFSDADATPQGPNHRAQLVAYTRDCITGLADPAYDDDRAELKIELDSLLAFFEGFPDSGEEFRETYHAESAALVKAADEFTRHYLIAALWVGVEYPDGHPDRDHDKRTDLTPSDIHPDALKGMIAECADFQKTHADLLSEAYARDGYGGGEWSAEAQAGHDFWLTRNHHGAGFWDRAALEEGGLGDKLTEAAHAYGESDLYTGDNGGIYES